MRRIAGLLAVLLVAFTSPPVGAQSQADIAMKFFLQGGAYCFRLAPEGVNLSDQTEWTIMFLTGRPTTKNTFRIRSVDPGPTRMGGRVLTEVGLAVTAVWRQEGIRAEFFDRFASGIAGKTLRARVLKMAPPALPQLTSRQRAELYLKFADRGTRIIFDKAPELTPEEFKAFADYVPD